jgi:hypothetical protein
MEDLINDFTLSIDNIVLVILLYCVGLNFPKSITVLHLSHLQNTQLITHKNQPQHTNCSWPLKGGRTAEVVEIK